MIPAEAVEAAEEAIGAVSDALAGMYGDSRASEHAGLNSVESVRAGRRK